MISPTARVLILFLTISVSNASWRDVSCFMTPDVTYPPIIDISSLFSSDEILSFTNYSPSMHTIWRVTSCPLTHIWLCSAIASIIDAKSKAEIPARRSVKISSNISKSLSCDLRCFRESENNCVSCLFERLAVTSVDVSFLEISLTVSSLNESSCSFEKRSTSSYSCSVSSPLPWLRSFVGAIDSRIESSFIRDLRS